jgi:hypothetical protein
MRRVAMLPWNKLRYLDSELTREPDIHNGFKKFFQVMMKQSDFPQRRRNSSSMTTEYDHQSNEATTHENHIASGAFWLIAINGFGDRSQETTLETADPRELFRNAHPSCRQGDSMAFGPLQPVEAVGCLRDLALFGAATGSLEF